MKDKQFEELGNRIRQIRQEKKISLNELSKRTALTKSFLSQFERGLTNASVDSIIKIVDSLDSSLSQLFESLDDSTPLNLPYLLRKSERKKVEFIFPFGKTDAELLTIPNESVEIYITDIPPGTSTEKEYSYRGKIDFILVLEGQLEVKVEDVTYLLFEGDTITLDDTRKKGWKNNGPITTRVLWVNSK